MNWIVLRALNCIYSDGKVKTKKTLEQDPEIAHLVEHTRELVTLGDYFYKGQGFDEYYELHHLKKYLSYVEFLTKHGLMKSQFKMDDRDIDILMELDDGMKSGKLQSIRQQIISAHESIRGVSLMFFRHEKHLLKRPSLVVAVKQLLDIKSLADEKDQQFKYTLECHNTRMIVLCENLNFLKRPVWPRENGVELWYAGGKNINKLDYVSTRGLPIYYSCDWDYDGLKIYEAVKRKIDNIRLLFPNGEPKCIVNTEHDSLWQKEQMSNLAEELYNEQEKVLIKTLIANNQWIIEESNDLMKMLENRPPNRLLI